MMMVRFVVALLMMLPLWVVAGEYEETTFKGIHFRVYRVEAGAVELYWRDPVTKEPYRRLGKVAEAMAAKGKRVAFMMNAGIFEPGCVPSGLHVEGGKTLRPLNLKKGEGNFFLMPNGVFGVDGDGKAFVLESRMFRVSGIKPRLAVQSGPLLLQAGRVHPAFSKDSPNHRHRNGVGVDAAGKVVFVCTAPDQEKYATLYEFAEYFASLGCADALFLDGDLSHMAVGPEPKLDISNEYGAVFAVGAPAAVEKKAEPADRPEAPAP